MKKLKGVCIPVPETCEDCVCSFYDSDEGFLCQGGYFDFYCEIGKIKTPQMALEKDSDKCIFIVEDK